MCITYPNFCENINMHGLFLTDNICIKEKNMLYEDRQNNFFGPYHPVYNNSEMFFLTINNPI